MDPTGGGYTSPTLLFTPAVAVPPWKARAIASFEIQTPSDVHAGFRPGLGGEIGLPGGVTIGAGTQWVGGDVSADTGRTDFNLGLSPYVQARVHLVGDAAGQGFQLGIGGVYKFVGFEGDAGEIEVAMSAQYRRARYELGVQGVVGQDLAVTQNRDGEVHVYAVLRLVPVLAVGAAGQLRVALSSGSDEDRSWDAMGGAIASLTIDRFQLGALAGASTLGLGSGQAGGLGQVYGSVRF